MVQVMHFYMDDSGTRHPDRKIGRKPSHGYDWFGLGGVLIRQEDEEVARSLHSTFCRKWNVTKPLHSAEIRSMSGAFAWLGTACAKKRQAFLEDLYQLMAQSPLVGTACVIDRPGYNHRYLDKYGRDRWLLCKTAFSVAVERTTKFADSQGYKLKVFVERSDRKTDKTVKDYYDALRSEGMPFSSGNSSIYAPLSADKFGEVLYEFRTKNKSSPVMQLADLFLWPMCIGGYDRENRPHKRLLADRKLIDCILPAATVPMLGIKYSCWELVEPNLAKKN